MLSILRRYPIARRREHATLAFEALEDRRLLAILTVTSLADAGAGSLRDAVAIANAAPGPDTIDFDPSLTGGTIRLTSGEIVVTESLDVDGPGAELLTISGEDNSRLLHGSSISGDVDLTIGEITLSGGRTIGERQPGGAVWLESSGFTSGTLTISSIVWTSMNLCFRLPPAITIPCST